MVEAIARSDRKLVAEVYKDNLPAIIHHVKQNSGSEEEARDLFQEGLTVVFRQAKAGKLVLTASLSTYINAVCRKLWLKQLRRKSNSGVTFSVDLESTSQTAVSEDFLEALHTHDRQLLFKKQFNLLGSDCKELLALFFEGISMAEIAEKMQFNSVAYAKKRKFKCKEKLVDSIKKDPLFRELTNN
ncbi:MAG: RNA polymerase sigma factor (sigma-70 family) [Limisphaerales bacterium]